MRKPASVHVAGPGGRTRARYLMRPSAARLGLRRFAPLRAPPRARPHIGALAGSRAEPDFQHFARLRIAEALGGQGPVTSGRGVERMAFEAAAAEEEPDQNEREE